MKNLLVLFLLLPVIANAQTTEKDSIRVKELGEVVVEAKTQRVIDRGVAYTPTAKVKKAAIDATQLLDFMNIPQLDVTPGSMSVKTYSGKNVAMFIDYKEATEEDLQGLRTEDVLRVEVLQYPEDPRFRGNANVVNFIMKKYEWGGYTKLTAIGNTLNYDRGEGVLYSKFVKGNWTIDANVKGNITHIDKLRSYNVETFRNINVGDQYYDEIIRTTQSGGNYLNQSNTQTAAMRSTYQTKTMTINHMLSYYRTGNPLTRNLSQVDYSEDIFPVSTSLSKESGQTISPSIVGYYYFSLPKGNTLLVNWRFTYGSTRRNSSYQLGELTPIVNNNKEASYAPNAIVQYSKKLSHNNTVRTSLMSYNSIYHTNYEGSFNGLQKLLSSENMMFLEYLQNWKCGLSLYSRVGVSYVIGRLNGVNTLEQWNPRLGLQLQYKINDKNSASIEGWWGNNHPTPSSSNSATVQSNELLWLQGNPDLRNTTFTSASASYTYIPTNKVNLSATAEYNGFIDKPAYEYFSLDGYDGLIRREINSGDFYDFSGYISATVKLFHNSLSLRGSGQITHARCTGVDAQSMNALSAKIQANYYIKNFSFVLFYQTPNKSINAFGDGIRIHNKSTYGVFVNYSVGDFKAGIQFRNWFNKYRNYSDFDSERFSSHGWVWSSLCAQSLNLTISYTVPYGKKVKRNNEIDSSSSSSSAILK